MRPTPLSNCSQGIKSKRTVLDERYPVIAIFFPTQFIRYSSDLVSVDFYDSLGIMIKVIPNSSILGARDVIVHPVRIKPTKQKRLIFDDIFVDYKSLKVRNCILKQKLTFIGDQA